MPIRGHNQHRVLVRGLLIFGVKIWGLTNNKLYDKLKKEERRAFIMSIVGILLVATGGGFVFYAKRIKRLTDRTSLAVGCAIYGGIVMFIGLFVAVMYN